MIDDRENIQDITLDDEKGVVSIKVSTNSEVKENLSMKRIITSGGGKSSVSYQAIDSLLTKKKIGSSLTITADQIFLLMSQLEQKSTIRGFHNTALATPERILVFRSDIGRHNTLDMINGTCFLENIPLEDKILVISGRVSSEMLLKTAKMGVPFLISHTVVTHYALTLAQILG